MAQERQIGDVTAVGAAVFSINTIFIGLILGEAIPGAHGALFGVAPQFLFFGGVILAVVGILSFMQGPGYNVFTLWWLAYAGFFLSTGFLLFFLEGGLILRAAAEGGGPTLGDTLGAFALAWALLTFCLWLVSYRMPLVPFIFLGLLTLAFSLLAAGWWTANEDPEFPFTKTVQAGGWVLVAYGTVVFYVFLSLTHVTVGGKALPLGPSLLSLIGRES